MRSWTKCSCGHLAQDHNIQHSGNMFACDTCACADYDGKAVRTKQVVRETITASPYWQPKARPSALVPGLLVPTDDHYVCPRCNSSLELKHGVPVTCSCCQLRLTRYGNALELEGTPV